MASLAGEYEVVLVARSDGLMAADVAPAGASLGASHRRGEWSTRTRLAGGGGRFDYAYFTDEVLRDYAKKAVHQAIVNLDARPAPAGTMTVVLGAGWPGILLHEAIGHGLEGDFNRKGSSASPAASANVSLRRALPWWMMVRSHGGADRLISMTREIPPSAPY